MTKEAPAKKPAPRNIADRKWIAGELGSSFPTLEEMREKIGEEHADHHYRSLQPFKELVLKAEELCPLEMSYDVSRIQHPYFNEFTWTTLLGGIYISPQSGWLAAILARQAAGDENAIPYVPPVGDKYELEEPAGKHRHVFFAPGTNVFRDTVSIEALTELMAHNDEVVIKPHPLTSPDTIRMLGREFGYHRILSPKASGAAVLRGCKVAYVAPTTELGLFGLLIGKKVKNVGNPLREARAGFSPIYSVLREQPDALPRFLGSDLGGFFRADEPDLVGRLTRFFANAMTVREGFRPPVREIGPTEYADFMAGKFVRRDG